MDNKIKDDINKKEEQNRNEEKNKNGEKNEEQNKNEEKNEEKNKNEEQNIINDNEEKSTNVKKDNYIKNNDIDLLWDTNPKYKINYKRVIDFLNSRNRTDCYNNNEYWCNILLMSSEIELSNKISILNILSNIYQKKKRYELIYNLANKYDKNLDLFNTVEPAFAINIFIKAINLLNNQNTFFYSYRYMLKIKNIIKNNLVYIKKKYNIDNVTELCDKIKSNFSDFINNYKEKYMKDDFFKIEDVQALKNLIDSLLSGKYNIDNGNNMSENDKDNDINNNNNFLYAINNDWILKAKIFIENYIKVREQKINNFYDESFDPEYMYDSYFNENNEKDKKNTKNTKNVKISKVFSAFPGPVNNFGITSFKDYWIDFFNLDENDFIKKGMKLNENYLLIHKKDWKLIKSFFGATNEIKRKKDNLDLVQLKFILIDERINSNIDNNNLLKQKYIQISINSTVEKLKEKIINIINENLKDIEVCKENISKKQQISFYILDENKRQILIEMCLAYAIDNSYYDSIYLEKLNFKDESLLKDFFTKYNKEKHILLIEIFYSNDEQFLIDLNLDMNKEYKCVICNNKIEDLRKKYKCEICNFSLFCSEKCANQSKEHYNLHQQLLKILEKRFILKDLLSMNLESILSEDSRKGRVGLYNMGNTCYLNSALQVLSNTEDLTKYFLKKYFQTEINNGSSLGSKGFISLEYYKFINQMWNERSKKFCPKDFRINFCRATHLFLNSEQQDSQEFLLAVLDNLHEDLNRITNKKYMELKEQKEGESDEEASKRWWDYHKSRENSIIVDLFQGQFKSTIKCGMCGNRSISYDSYMNLGLPIPTKDTQDQIKFLTYDQRLIDINFRKNENFELKDIIKKATSYINSKNNANEKEENILYNNILVAEFSKGFKITNIYKTAYENISININGKKNMKQPLYDNLKISDIYNINNNSEIVLFERNINFDIQNDCDIFVYPIIDKEIKGFFSSSFKKVILSYPIIININKDKTLKELENIIYKKLEKIIKIKENEDSNPIEICFPHFKNWGKFNIQNEVCPICLKKYDNNKSCNLFNSIPKDKKIGDFINEKNKGRPLILYVKSNIYNLNKELYLGIPLFNENTRNETKMNLNIYDALDLFNKEEILDGDNMWFCNKCKEHRIAGKRIEIYKTPIYLIIQLKRFKNRNYFLKALFGNKNETVIDYKYILNLKEFVVGPDKYNSIYSLYGVIVHKKFMNGGHYFAHCKNNGIWITFNDEKFEKCDNPIDRDAYLLFYKKQNVE